ncbi:MAG: protein translocase subunit SecF, partial [Christensenellaceae bacterium]|nr:protein translocase subunit SecF [Christensenellaceae bacterium]
TVIIFDRIRDNSKKYPVNVMSTEELVDISVKESMGRTINTTITTLIMILMLYILGVESIRIFAFPIIIGIFAGTFSSMIVAPSVWALLSKKFGVKTRGGVKAIR